MEQFDGTERPFQIDPRRVADDFEVTIELADEPVVQHIVVLLLESVRTPTIFIEMVGRLKIISLTLSTSGKLANGSLTNVN